MWCPGCATAVGDAFNTVQTTLSCKCIELCRCPVPDRPWVSPNITRRGEMNEFSGHGLGAHVVGARTEHVVPATGHSNWSARGHVVAIEGGGHIDEKVPVVSEDACNLLQATHKSIIIRKIEERDPVGGKMPCHRGQLSREGCRAEFSVARAWRSMSRYRRTHHANGPSQP